jgi:tRNA pseudouridine38-40 synthase
MKVACVVEYDGTNFHGSQYHPTVRTVQGELNKAIETIFKRKLKTDMAGRTDAGVHANYQVFSFERINPRMTERNVKEALNSILPEDMRVRDVWFTRDNFSPRVAAVKRVYQYFIYNRKEKDIFLRKRAWWFPYELDVKKMREAARYLEGYHDFTSFVSKDKRDDRSPMRTIYRIRIIRISRFIMIRVEGKSYLKRMVRNIVGTLVKVGVGTWEPSYVKELLEMKDRSKAGATAPAHGLYLYKVLFDKEFSKE